MFEAQAHSFTQQARLAITLAWVGGYTNILSILTCGTATSHVSGTTSLLGRQLAAGAWSEVGFALVLVGSFFLGAMLSGVFTEAGRRRGWNSVYALPMIVEAAMLLLFALGLEVWGTDILGNPGLIYLMSALASCGMGLQNATITRISSGVVRTTHVTGVVTDLGLETVQFILWVWDRRHSTPPFSARAALRSALHHPTPKRLAMLASIFGSFAIGATLGTIVHTHYARWAMFPPVLFLLWIIYQDLTVPIAEIDMSELSASSAMLGLPEGLAVYHLRQANGREGTRQRLPNLAAWVARLPELTRVVVLDIGAGGGLRREDLDELRATVLRMKLSGRRLIIAGIGPSQMDAIRRAWGDDLIHEDVCPDVELAIAHGMNVVEHLAGQGAG